MNEYEVIYATACSFDDGELLSIGKVKRIANKKWEAELYQGHNYSKKKIEFTFQSRKDAYDAVWRAFEKRFQSLE